MASGYFPVSATDKWGDKLRRAKQLIGEVVDDWYESRGVLNAEDAAADAVYVSGLHAAAEKIGECVEPDATNRAEVEAMYRAAESRRELAERESDRWSAALAKLKAKELLDAAAPAPQ